MFLYLSNSVYRHLERYLKVVFCVFLLPRTIGDATRSLIAELFAYLSAVVHLLLSVVRATVLSRDHTSVTRNEWRF